MSKADELLRRLFNEPFMAETIEECRAYLNEKPHEPIKDADGEATRSTAPLKRGESNVSDPASPPHAAAEPEKPVAWMYEDKGTKIVSHERWAQKYPYVETPLYASPSAQPPTK